ncbi:MAG TPA: peptidylprolyl isomerase, partial [Telluria sp.]
RRRVGEAALTSGPRVAFPRDVTFDDQLVSALRSAYGPQMESELRRHPGGLDGLLRGQTRPDFAALDALAGKPGVLQLDARYNAAQLDAARKLVLLRYAMPDGGVEGTVTLADVYQRQNVQGRVALIAHDADFMLAQAKQLVGARYVLHWGERRFGGAALADLRAALAEQADAQAFMRMHGVGEDAHGDSTLIDQLSAKTSKEEVRDYYQRHRDQFVRIERVLASHIRVPDEAAAAKVAALLAGGADFAATARRYSIARDAASGGALGWVRHAGSPSWLAQLVFTFEAGEVSPPVRMPGGPDENPAWELVRVEQRVQGWHPVDSESVRYAASRAIGREKALKQLAALRKELNKSARVEIIAVAGAPS